MDEYFDGLVQDCTISIANAMEILQSCIKPSIFNPIFYMNAITYPCPNADACLANLSTLVLDGPDTVFK